MEEIIIISPNINELKEVMRDDIEELKKIDNLLFKVDLSRRTIDVLDKRIVYLTSTNKTELIGRHQCKIIENSNYSIKEIIKESE